MKVFVQIPCLNEESTLPLVLNSIPTKLPGVELEIVVIDDGSTDDTIKVAKQHGVKHIVHHKSNRGLAKSFQDGVNYALSHGADIVVNTDGDNQYPQAKIPELIQPILDGEADIVVGDRQTQTIAHFSLFKKFMQRFGSWVVNKAAGTNVPDAASGFRAYSREALYQLNVVTDFSYCTETIIQAGHKKLAIASIPVTTNKKTRESRLFKNVWQHMYRSAVTIIRSFIMYRPYFLFLRAAFIFGTLGSLLFVRYLFFYLNKQSGEHLQSLLLGIVLLTAALLSVALGVLADLVAINRRLSEDAYELEKRARKGNA